MVVRRRPEDAAGPSDLQLQVFAFARGLEAAAALIEKAATEAPVLTTLTQRERAEVQAFAAGVSKALLKSAAEHKSNS